MNKAYTFDRSEKAGECSELCWTSTTIRACIQVFQRTPYATRLMHPLHLVNGVTPDNVAQMYGIALSIDGQCYCLFIDKERNLDRIV
jgi:hypothetical protein